MPAADGHAEQGGGEAHHEAPDVLSHPVLSMCKPTSGSPCTLGNIVSATLLGTSAGLVSGFTVGAWLDAPKTTVPSTPMSRSRLLLTNGFAHGITGALAALLFKTGQCSSASIRGVEDNYNNFVGGMLGGSVLAFRATSSFHPARILNKSLAGGTIAAIFCLCAENDWILPNTKVGAAH